MIKYLNGVFLFALLSIIVLAACSKQSENTDDVYSVESINYEEPFKNNLFGMTETGELIKITKEKFMKRWRDYHSLSKEDKIVNLHIAREKDNKTGEEVLLLKGNVLNQDADQKMSFATVLNYNKNENYLMSRECICACVSQQGACGGQCDAYGSPGDGSCWCNSCSPSLCSSFKLCDIKMY